MDTLVKCPSCASTNCVRQTGHHHFVESGLDNVHLVNVDVLVCGDCGDRLVSIPKAPELMKCIAEGILIKPSPLSGPEIRFLRKNLMMKISDLAQLIGVDRVTVSRWENGHETPTRSTDRLIRLAYAAETDVSGATRKKLSKRLRADEIEAPLDYFLRLPIDAYTCSAEP